MMRWSRLHLYHPFKLPARSRLNPDGTRRVAKTVPPPPVAELGGLGGTSTRYSGEFSSQSYEERMAHSTYDTRMSENRTLYPMSEDRPGEYDIRWLPKAQKDPLREKPLLEVGEKDEIPRQLMVPVIFVCNVKQMPRDEKTGAASGQVEDLPSIYPGRPQDVKDGLDTPGIKSSATFEAETGAFEARKHETHYVTQSFMRRKLQPQRLAVYATPENYRLLGLPARDHNIHVEIPKSQAHYSKLRAKQLWDNERWRFSFEMLFRRYDRGPPELLDDVAEDEWDGNEEVAPSAGDGKGSAAGGAATVRKGPVVQRKAKKIKLF